MDLSTTLVILASFILTICCFDGRNTTYPNEEADMIMSRTIKPGASLRGRSIQEILPHNYIVAAAGTVENYTKWPLMLVTCEEASGKVTMPIVNVRPGIMEAFASRKTAWTATGSWARYSLMLDSDIMAHFMYSVPFNFDYYFNNLAVALCATKSRLCQSMNAKNMYYNDYPFMERRRYYSTMYPVKRCYDNVCILGSMQQSHHPVIRLKVYPKSYYDIPYSIRVNKPISPNEYESFIKFMFKL